MNRSTRLKRSAPLRERVIDAVRTLLLQCEFAPGERVTEGRVGELLSVSRTPVREALGLLSLQGMLERRHGGGYVVPNPTQDELHDFIVVRKILEVAAADKAITHASSKDLLSLQKIVQREKRALENANAFDFFSLTVEFWKEMWRLSGSKGLFKCTHQFVDQYQCQFASVRALQDRGVRIKVIEDHSRLVDALVSGNREEAKQIVSAHLDYKERKLSEAIGNWHL